MKTWAERNPHPGEAPARPSDEHPTDAKLLQEWWVARAAWDIYVKRMRKHEVALAVDALNDLAGEQRLKPEQSISLKLGVSWLDGSLSPPSFPF